MRVLVYFTISTLTREETIRSKKDRFNMLIKTATEKSDTVVEAEPEKFPRWKIKFGEDPVGRLIWNCRCEKEDLDSFIEAWRDAESKGDCFVLHLGTNGTLQ